jgi:hypothetical protein
LDRRWFYVTQLSDRFQQRPDQPQILERFLLSHTSRLYTRRLRVLLTFGSVIDNHLLSKHLTLTQYHLVSSLIPLMLVDLVLKRCLL